MMPMMKALTLRVNIYHIDMEYKEEINPEQVEQFVSTLDDRVVNLIYCTNPFEEQKTTLPYYGPYIDKEAIYRSCGLYGLPENVRDQIYELILRDLLTNGQTSADIPHDEQRSDSEPPTER